MASFKSLNVRLLRKGKKISDAISERFLPGKEEGLNERSWPSVPEAKLYVGQIYKNEPTWVKALIEGSIDIPENMFSSGAGAVIFIPIKRRTVAICFGHIHLALNDDVFERQFGLKVTLNTVPRDGLRTLDTATPDAVTFQKRIQASKDSDLQRFGVDVLRDLARVAGGTPKDKSFAKFVAGKDSLSLTGEVQLTDLLAKCDSILENYEKKDYRKDFQWIDNMRIVNEKDIIDELEKNLFSALSDIQKGLNSELHMCPPEIVDYVEGCQLHYNGFGSHGVTFHSLSIKDYVAELSRCGFAGGIAEIKGAHTVKSKAVGSEGYSERWKVYDCFVFETSISSGKHKGNYILFSGDWYCVNKSFKDGVERFYDSIEISAIVGPTTCRNEEELILHLDKNRSDLLKLDREKVNPGGVINANLEPCDFFSSANEFIHLKDGHSSGPISHLWSQGVVSTEAFVSDPVFREKLRDKVKSFKRGFETQLPRKTEKINRSNYKVVYGIMRRPYADGTLGIPFFSKVSFQAAAQRIQQFDIAVSIEIIEKK